MSLRFITQTLLISGIRIIILPTIVRTTVGDGLGAGVIRIITAVGIMDGAMAMAILTIPIIRPTGADITVRIIITIIMVIITAVVIMVVVIIIIITTPVAARIQDRQTEILIRRQARAGLLRPLTERQTAIEIHRILQRHREAAIRQALTLLHHQEAVTVRRPALIHLRHREATMFHLLHHQEAVMVRRPALIRLHRREAAVAAAVHHHQAHHILHLRVAVHRLRAAAVLIPHLRAAVEAAVAAEAVVEVPAEAAEDVEI